MNYSNVSVMLAAMAGFMYGDKDARIKFAARTDGIVHSCNPAQHNTLRYDQVERARKLQRRNNRLKFKQYRRAT